jgi:hypothetical protein
MSLKLLLSCCIVRYGRWAVRRVEKLVKSLRLEVCEVGVSEVCEVWSVGRTQGKELGL